MKHRYVAAVATALACALLAAAAHGEPITDSDSARQQNEQISGKKHEDVRHWLQVGGAPHPDQTVIEGSPTPYDADLFAVRFLNPHTGLIGGSACAEPTPPAEADGCQRVPMIYGTSNGRDWSEYRFDGLGYVGGIAWINNKTALAVGGTGAYPRREPNPPGAEWDYDKRVAYDAEHGAGEARAWLYTGGSWHEITDSLPEGMRGLSALDVWIGREADGSEWGVAGGYGQLWEWKGGEFTGKRLDRDSPSIGGEDPQWSVVKGATSGFSTGAGAESSDPALFQYRVREVRIAPDRTQKRAFAFTAGCCGLDADGNGQSDEGGSRRIEYVPKPRKDETGVPANEAPPPAERPRWVVSNKDYGDSVYSFALKPGRFYNQQAPNSPTDQFGEPQPKERWSPTWSAGETVVAPGGPESGDSSQAPRYIASDGDTEPTVPPAGGALVTGNGVPDWIAGSSRSVDPASDGLGLLQTTVTALRPEYGGLRPRCPPSGSTSLTLGLSDEAGGNPNPENNTLVVCRAEQIQGNQMPTLDEEGPLRTREDGIVEGPSWGLNAIDMLDAEGAGFAVGDRGAILRLDAPPAAESDPPPVGTRRPAPLGERSPYEPLRPPPAVEAGAVPPIAAQPRRRLPEPRLYRAGSPDASEAERTAPLEDVHTIVMSRDGQEGWAIGPSSASGVMTLYGYQGGAWRRCDPVGTQFTEPDPACAELEPLSRHRNTSGSPLRLTAAARVSLENDADPSNDDELEIVAAGTALETLNGKPIPTVIRYADGRWRLEDLAVRRTLNPDVGGVSSEVQPLQLAFASPNDGWMVSTGGFGTIVTESAPVLRRFDGERWIDCSTRNLRQGEVGQVNATGPLVNREACGDTGDRLAVPDRAARISLAMAGGRVYLSATRPPPKAPNSTGVNTNLDDAARSLGTGPLMILYKDAGAGEQWRADGGGYDPGPDDPNALRGSLASITVARREDGGYEGWAVGVASVGLAAASQLAPEGLLLRLDPSSAEWRPWRANDAASDYLTEAFAGVYPAGVSPTKVNPSRQLTLPGSGAESGRAFIAAPFSSHALSFNPERERWEVLEKPGGTARPMAFSPDGRGGAWAAYSADAYDPGSATYFYDYTDTPPRDVFSEVANPIGAGAERPTALTGSPDGMVWLATNSGALYRYDRLTGWERVRIPGWDPGRILTRRSAVNAIAVGPDGAGLAVGERGKVADISPAEVRLDAAAGTVCRKGTPAPCGTSFDLRAVAVATDGSALAGGEGLALLWRPAGGELRKIAPPGAPATAAITGITMPSSDRAWLALDTGQVFAGTGDGQGNWSWEVENQIEIADQDRLLSEDSGNQPIALRAIAIDEEGHGYAVGDRGLVLERTGDDDQPWRRGDAGVSEELTAVALPAGEGEGALIGGNRGLILTRSGGEWHIARAGDRLRPDNGFVTGLALLPGTQAGQVEAWAAVAPQRSGEGTSQLLHYASDPGDPLLDAGDTHTRAAALPDVPAPRPGEVSFAAFGRSDCHRPDDRFPCPPLEGTTNLHETVLRRVRDEILARSREPGGPQFAIHTGDGNDTAGPNAIEAVEQNSQFGARTAGAASTFFAFQWTGGFRFRRLNEQLLDPIADRGLPLFGAIGSRDLSETRQCYADIVATGQYVCAENRDRPRVGENLAWRQAMEQKPAPWGGGEPAASAGALAFKPLRDSTLAVRVADVAEDPDGEQGPADDVHVPIGGASTHYAADIVRGDAKVARLVVLDTSLGSLAASDPISQPLEPDGQAAWLEKVLCLSGQRAPTGERCTRASGQQAIVVSNTPTYSYGPTDPTQTQADAVLFESILLRHRASVVVSGKLGWNGRYWATAPGLHEPCPGEGYPGSAPPPGARACGQGAADLPVNPDALLPQALALSNVLGDTAAPEAAGQLSGVTGDALLPFVVASGAGGRFDELAEGAGQATAANGFWRGYTIVRLDPSGDPAKLVVEQRPVLDWVGIAGQAHVLRAGQTMKLRGVGREPIGAASAGVYGGGRFDAIDTPAITHRYALVEADPQRPWVPRLAGDSSGSDSSASSPGSSSSASKSSSDEGGSASTHGPYVPLDPSIATLDSQTGQVKVGRGNHPRAFAIAILSVGCSGAQAGADGACDSDDPGVHSASFPLVFEPRKTFVPVVVAAPVVQQRAASAGAALPPPPQAPPAGTAVQPLNLPPPPNPPALPPIDVPQVQAPSPPIPPPPPIQQSPVPLDLSASAPGVTIAPQTTVIPPPAPPIQPAPPGGARREARQRQSATQSSGSGSGEGADVQHGGGDLAQSPPTQANAATRLDPRRAEPSFTPLARADQPSAWARGALYGGGITLMVLAATLGWNHGRPGPRRRSPVEAAPARAQWTRRR